MKVKLNVLTNYERQTLNAGDEVDIPLNVAQRWINKGIAHVPKEEVKPVEKKVIKAESKIGNTILSPLHEILPEIKEENIDKLKTSKPTWKPKKSKKIKKDEDNS